MGTDITELNSEIEKFKNLLDEYTPKLDGIKSQINDDIVEEQSKLDDILKKTYAEQTKFVDLNGKSNKLKINIKNYNTQITSLEHKKSTMELEECNLDDVRKDVEQEKQRVSTLKTELELIRVETEGAQAKLNEYNEEISKLNSEKSTLTTYNSELTVKLAEANNNHRSTEKILKTLLLEQEAEEKTLKIKKEDTASEEERLLMKQDEVNTETAEIEELMSKKKTYDQEIKNTIIEITKIREEKGIFLTELETERKKLRNEENRLIALKKDVLKFILEYKDAGNKAQIAKFAQSVEDGP